jgi:hypothetical protein
MVRGDTVVEAHRGCERQMGRTGVVILVCGLLPIAACTRTSDGTVVMRRPPSLASLLPGWARREARSGEPAIAEADFPPPAPEPAPPVQAASAPAILLGPSRTLACRNQSEPGGRVRVVCR